MAIKLGIQTYQVLTYDDEVCIPSLSSILLAVCGLISQTIILKELISSKQIGTYVSSEAINPRHVMDHPYITSGKGLGGWVEKMETFADVQCCN